MRRNRQTADRSGGTLAAMERSLLAWRLRKAEGDPRVVAGEEWLRVYNRTHSRKAADMAECRKRLELLERDERWRAERARGSS